MLKWLRGFFDGVGVSVILIMVSIIVVLNDFRKDSKSKYEYRERRYFKD